MSQKDIDKAIQDTRTGRKCRCQEIGLRPGLTVAELNRMGAGCTGSHMPSVPGQRHALPLPWVGNLSPGERVGYVCPVLNRVRRALES